MSASVHSSTGATLTTPPGLSCDTISMFLRNSVWSRRTAVSQTSGAISCIARPKGSSLT